MPVFRRSRAGGGRPGAGAAAVAAVALVLGAPAGAALSPTAYRARAATVCTSAKTDLQKLVRGLPHTRAGLRRYLERALPIGTRYLARLRALDPPPAFAADHRRLEALVAGEIAALHRALARLKAGAPMPAVMDDPRAARLSAQEDAIWKKLRVRACRT
jgi:hypothetical protein